PNAAFDEYERSAVAAISAAATAEQLEAARVEFLGKKQGRLKDLQKLLGQVAAEERRVIGQRFNEVKTKVESLLSSRQKELDRPKRVIAGIDITLPGRTPKIGVLHPITQTIEEFKDIMGRFGFTAVEGPEIEDEQHNFTALNIPAEHPARDPLDNFYIAAAGVSSGGPVLLRSQTSTVQIRTMERTPPPIRIVSLGRVYRPDTQDDTHSCMFHQMEGLMVDRDVTMAQLKTVLALFAKAYLGEDVKVRFRPSFFPFTEPSVEVDMLWGETWIEVGGAGMVDPNVLRAVGYDPEAVTGFAFGLGVERFCMRRHEVRNIRLFYENDARFLRQF
ncbi:MAG: phenylalanine--tRNA ligase subunit alpha, partial [Planctomycetota bacterium]|nr:phenylalanine--tRNA ligase subunit alpha [Planctomycetota bacterium]